MEVMVVLVAGLVIAVSVLVVRCQHLAAELGATKARFKGYMDHGPFLAFMKDADGRYVYENRMLVEHIKRVRPGTTSCIGRTDRELFATAEQQAYVGNDRRVIQGGVPLRFDETSIDADGVVRYWSTVKFSYSDNQGNQFLAGISVDVTEMCLAKRNAQANEDRFRLAIEAGRMGTLTMDLKTQMLDTSSLFAVLHGRPPTKTRLSLTESLAEVHPDDREAIVEAVHAALRDRAPSRIMYRVIKPDESTSWIELIGQVYVDDDGHPAMVRGVGCDVTERQVALEELTRGKTLLRRLIEVQESERQMLCHELHDGMMQYVIGASMQLQVAQAAAESADQGQRIATALACLSRGIAEGRQVIRGVRSAVLDDLGLSAGIHDLVDQMSAFGIMVDVSLFSELDAIPKELRTTVYRLVQEALTNVRRHADTDRATIRIERTPGGLCVTVSDPGKGFDVEEMRHHGFGIVGMTERVRLAGGACEITSQPGSGSRVTARLSIPDGELSGMRMMPLRCDASARSA